MRFFRKLFGDPIGTRRRQEIQKIARRNTRVHVGRNVHRMPISTYMISEANKKAERLERIFNLA